jgi:hypothetical protein
MKYEYISSKLNELKFICLYRKWILFIQIFTIKIKYKILKLKEHEYVHFYF